MEKDSLQQQCIKLTLTLKRFQYSHCNINTEKISVFMQLKKHRQKKKEKNITYHTQAIRYKITALQKQMHIAT
jgi:hypothetical protein